MARTKREPASRRADGLAPEAVRLGQAIKLEVVADGRYRNQEAAADAAGIDASRLSVWFTGKEQPQLATSLLPALERWQQDFPEIHLAGIENSYEHLRGRVGPYRRLQEENRSLKRRLADAEKAIEEYRRQRRGAPPAPTSASGGSPGGRPPRS